MQEEVLSFFEDLWSIAVDRHRQGIYNTVCLVVLLALPLVVLFTSLVVCCHCCCCRKGSCCGCCRRGDHASGSKTKADKKKKKKSPKNEDLWISVKPGPMTPDRMALTMV